MKWLFGKDEMGVPRYLYILFWIATGFALLGVLAIVMLNNGIVK